MRVDITNGYMIAKKEEEGEKELTLLAHHCCGAGIFSEIFEALY